MKCYIHDYQTGEELREATFFEIYRVIEERYDKETGCFFSDEFKTVYLTGVSMNEDGSYNEEELYEAETEAWNKLVREDKELKDKKK